MPYIHPADRDRVTNEGPRTGGELTYQFTLLCRQYLNDRRDGLSYNTFADIISALETTKFVIQDTDMRRYEAAKRHENGDV